MSNEPDGKPTAFDVVGFRTRLRELGCALGEPLHYFSSTTSTNDEAKRAAGQGVASGALFVADHQTTGRGRRGRTWHAPPNEHLLVSVLVRPRGASSNPSALTLAVGVALHQALQPLLTQVGVEASLGIKWPNDIEMAGRKLAGILVEAQLDRDGQLALIVGFGINVAAVIAPDDGRARPVSLRELGVQLSRESVLLAVLPKLASAVSQFYRSGLPSFVSYANSYNALQACVVSVEGVVGRVVEIGALGELVLETPNGCVSITAGTVERHSATPQ